MSSLRERVTAASLPVDRYRVGMHHVCFEVDEPYDALLDGIEWEEYGPGNDPRCEHCAIHSGFEPSAAYEAAGSLKESARSMAWTLTG